MKILLAAAGLLASAAVIAWLSFPDFEAPIRELGAAPLAAAADGGGPDWRRAGLWDDGQAEFAAYEVTWPRYGHRFAGRALLILVKEPWAPDLEVKADRPRPDGFEVLKLNHVRDVATGIYSYHQMASVFFRRDDGRLRKLAATSSEGCGIATALLEDGRLEVQDYFDGSAHQTLDYPPGALPEDGLPALLRDFVGGTPPAAVEVFPSLMRGRFGQLEPVTYRLTREAVTVTVPAGTFPGVEIRLSDGTASLAYAFDRQPPHVLLRLARDDGTEYRLAKVERLAYWTRNRPGGEAWLPEAVR